MRSLEFAYVWERVLLSFASCCVFSLLSFPLYTSRKTEKSKVCISSVKAPSTKKLVLVHNRAISHRFTETSCLPAVYSNLVCRLNLEASRRLASPTAHLHVLHDSHQTTFPEAATHERVRTHSRCPSPHCCSQLAPSRWSSALGESQAAVLYLLCQIHMNLRLVCECTRLGHRCCTKKRHRGGARYFNNSSRFCSTAVARIVRAGPVFAAVLPTGRTKSLAWPGLVGLVGWP